VPARVIFQFFLHTFLEISLKEDSSQLDLTMKYASLFFTTTLFLSCNGEAGQLRRREQVWSGGLVDVP
jgi:hypothetical protein